MQHSSASAGVLGAKECVGAAEERLAGAVVISVPDAAARCALPVQHDAMAVRPNRVADRAEQADQDWRAGRRVAALRCGTVVPGSWMFPSMPVAFGVSPYYTTL